MLSLTDTPTCCCLYSTGVWKQAPTHFLSLFWHSAYHLPQDFMLRIIQLLVCAINFLPCPTECQVARHCWCDAPRLTWKRLSFIFPLYFTTGQAWKALKDLACSVSFLYCSRTPKYQKQAPIYIHENLSWKQNWTQEPRWQAGPSFDGNRFEQDLGTDLVHRKVLLSCRFKIWSKWSPRTGERAQPSCQRAMQIQITMQWHHILLEVLLHSQRTGRTNCRIL